MSYCRMHYNLPNPLTPSFSHHFLIPALILPQSPKKNVAVGKGNRKRVVVHITCSLKTEQQKGHVKIRHVNCHGDS